MSRRRAVPVAALSLLTLGLIGCGSPTVTRSVSSEPVDAGKPVAAQAGTPAAPVAPKAKPTTANAPVAPNPPTAPAVSAPPVTTAPAVAPTAAPTAAPAQTATAPVAPGAMAAAPAPVDAAAAVKALQVRHGEGRYAFEEAVLDNGMRVVSLEDHSAPIVAVQLWYHVGSKDEQTDRQGFAHMFEHMMFRGTDRLGPKDHFDFIRRTGGDCNAYTAFDQTVYVEELPSNQLPMVLWLEAERMSALKIDEGGFHTERKVVEEERRLGLNQPYGDVLEKLLAALFTVHPYRWSPIGQIEHLEASTAQDIQKFWDTYYVPNNCTLVVVGDVTGAQVRELAQKSFGWIPRCANPPRVTAVEPPQTQLAKVEITPENGPVPIAGIAFRAVPQGHPDAVPLEMLMGILGAGQSSRVYLDLVRRKDIAVEALGLYAGLEQAGFAAVVGVTMPFGKTDKVMDGLWEQVDLVCKDGVTDEEMAKARKQALRDNVTEALSIASKAGALGQAATLFGDTQEANEHIHRIESVTKADLQRVAQAYLVRERATEITIKPGLGSLLRSAMSMAAGKDDAAKDDTKGEEAGGERARASGPKAAAKPPAGYPGAPPVAPPLTAKVELKSSEATLSNGLKLVVIENHEVPYVTANLDIKAGAFTEDPAAPGTASMAASLITKGTVARDAEALAAELERNAISLGAGADHDSANVSVSSLTDDSERALRLMAEVVSAPRFDAKEFQRLRDQTATGMAIAEKAPAEIANRAFDKALWGNHPYGRPAEGTSGDLKKLDANGLRTWWESFVRPQTSVLYVAGDITLPEAQKMAERYLGSWEVEGEPIEVPLPSIKAPTGTRITLVDKPGAIQSEIRAGHEGITRKNALYPTGAVLSQVFGGAFSSRLNEVIRVEKGLTYGAGGGLRAERFGGEFQVHTFTKTPTTAETVQAVIDQVSRMRTEPPSPKELNDAVSYLAGSFAGTLETPQSVAGRLWTLELNQLPITYWTDYLGRITTTTSEDVAKAAQELLDPERLIIVVVGDASQVKESLEKIAPVDVVTEGG